MPSPKVNELFREIDKRGGMEWVLEQIELGLGPTQICRAIGREHQRSWLNQRLNSPEYKERYQEAKRRSADAIADRIMDVVNTTTPETAQAARTQISALQWMAMKRNREEYGDQHLPLVQLNIGEQFKEAMQKYRKRVVEITPQLEAGEPNED